MKVIVHFSSSSFLRFYELKPQHDCAQLRVKELEKENADLKKSMKDQEDLHQTMVTLYSKEKQANTVNLSVSSVEKNNQGNQTDSVSINGRILSKDDQDRMHNSLHNFEKL